MSPRLGQMLALGAAAIAVGCTGLGLPGGPPAGAAAPDVAAAAAMQVSRALPAVEGLHAVSGELRAVPLRWQPVLAAGVTGYAVERAPGDGDAFEAIANVPGAFATVFVDRGKDLAPKAGADLGDGARYHYRVRAIDAGGVRGPASTPVPATTAPVPDRPQGVRAISQLPRQVAVSWVPSSDPTVAGYRVSRSPSALGEYRQVADLAGRFNTNWVDRGLGDLRVFHYRVRAVNAAGGEGEPSAAQQAVTKPEPLPPAGLVASAAGIGRNRLEWEPNVETDLAGYRVLRIQDGKAETLAELPAGETRYVDASVAPDEDVRYAVGAFDRDGLRSLRAGPVDVHSAGYGLGAAVEDGGVVLTWAPRARTRLAEARIHLVGTLGRTELGRALGTRFVVEAPAPGVQRYVVVGIRPDGSEAPPSRPIEVDVPAPAPDPTVATGGAAGKPG